MLKLQSELGEANKREDELNTKLKEATEERNKIRHRLESESSNASGEYLRCFVENTVFLVVAW